MNYPNLEDICKIASTLKENGLVFDGQSIIFEVNNTNELLALNTSIFNKCKSEGLINNERKVLKDAEEINVNIDGITFIYKVREDGSNS